MVSGDNAGGSKLNTELNLVPFIDLLSSLVLFLLITAVWIQVASIPASVDSKGKRAVASSPADRLVIWVTAEGHEMSWPSRPASLPLPPRLPRNSAGYDLVKLGQLLSRIATSGKVPEVAVTGEDGVSYGVIVKTIDVVKSSGFPSVAVSVN
jgi:biopolymer transport protein TolR